MTKSKELKGVHKYAEYKEETVIKRVQRMCDIRKALNPDELHVRISYENRKTTALVPSVSLIPVADCGQCKMCSKGCYAVRNMCYLPAVQKNLAINSAIAHNDMPRFFQEINYVVKFLKFFRFHVSGDLLGPAYLTGVVDVAIKNPQCQFLVFTKMSSLINDYLDDHQEGFPSNLHVILSGWRGDTNVNRHNLPVSSPVWPDGTKSCMATADAVWCPGDCSQCAEINGGCWGLKKGQTVLFEAH